MNTLLAQVIRSNGEFFSATTTNKDSILNPDSAKPEQINSRLIRHHHPSSQNVFAVGAQYWHLMNLQTHAVTKIVNEKLAITSHINHLPCFCGKAHLIS